MSYLYLVYLILMTVDWSTSLAQRPMQSNTIRRRYFNRQDAKCGTGPDFPAFVNGNRIINGINAVKNSWPSMVAILESGEFICGGTLLDEYHILTAAHCFDSIEPGNIAALSVNLGMHKLEPKMDPLLKRRIRKMTIHKDYVAQPAVNDIAILQMTTPVTYNSNISPVCLPPKEQNQFNKVKATVVGWGLIKDNPEVSPSVLQQVTIETRTNTECKLWYPRLLNSMICINSTSGKGFCKGDSGGPLFHKPSSTSPWIQIGIVSFKLKAFKCGDPRGPLILTRVTSFLPWIDQVIKSSRPTRRFL